jgi:hypothetical protein
MFESGFYNANTKRKRDGVNQATGYDGYDGIISKGVILGNYAGKNIYTEYNTFGLEWNEREIIWYINGVETDRLTGEWVPHVPQYLLLSVEVAGETKEIGVGGQPIPFLRENDNIEKNDPGIFPLDFVVDYVRSMTVFQTEQSHIKTQRDGPEINRTVPLCLTYFNRRWAALFADVRYQPHITAAGSRKSRRATALHRDVFVDAVSEHVNKITRGMMPMTERIKYGKNPMPDAPKNKLTKSIGNAGNARTTSRNDKVFFCLALSSLSANFLPRSRFSTYAPPKNLPSKKVTVTSSAMPTKLMVIACPVSNARPTEI